MHLKLICVQESLFLFIFEIVVDSSISPFCFKAFALLVFYWIWCWMCQSF